MGQSRWVIGIVVALLSFVCPASICAGLVLIEPASVIGATVGTLAAASWMLLLFLVNWWGFTSVSLRWAWLAALAAAVLYRAGSMARAHVVGEFTLWTFAGLALAAVACRLLAGAMAARRHEGHALELALPFGPGRFLVADGGDGARSFFVNYHYGFGRHRDAGVGRSMRYAVDLVELGRFGGESAGFLPRDNAAYRIWNRPLLAPCDGVVAHAEDSVPDNSAFGARRPYGVGNHVVIRADHDTYVVLGHVRHGTVAVATGDPVRRGQEIGRVGNSGWTERPHLHIQAMRSPDGDWWRGEPLPLRFAGRFLVRNEQVRA
jgi:hypothetical protein